MFSTVPASASRARAWMSTTPPSATRVPSCCRFVAAWAVLLTFRKIRPSPSRSIEASLAAAKPTRGAAMVPSWVTDGATRATVSAARMTLPASCTIAPAPWAVLLKL